MGRAGRACPARMEMDRVYYAEFPVFAAGWYAKNCCPACGRVNGTGKLCNKVVRCLVCGKRFCANPSGRCPECGGWLDGYFRRQETCGYKGCHNPAVREWPRVGAICLEHLKVKTGK